MRRIDNRMRHAKEVEKLEKKLEQLEREETKLHNEKEEIHGFYHQKITLYQKMFRCLERLASINPEEYSDSLKYVKNMLILSLIKYGTYKKMNDQKDDRLAISSLEEAVTLDAQNPIAHYRLGFLSYRKGNFGKAMHHFQTAIKAQPSYLDSTYLLNEQQLFHAHMYLTNSALQVAEETHRNMKKLECKSLEQLLNYEISPIYEILEQNKAYLLSHAFYRVEKEQVGTCSFETCSEIVDTPPSNHFVLYFGDRETIGVWNERSVVLSIQTADILKDMLIKCSEKKPGTRMIFKDHFQSTGADGEVMKNTFRKAINRLRNKLREVGLDCCVMKKNYLGETAYYFDQNIPYTVLYRVDDVI